MLITLSWLGAVVVAGIGKVLAALVIEPYLTKYIANQSRYRTEKNRVRNKKQVKISFL